MLYCFKFILTQIFLLEKTLLKVAAIFDFINLFLRTTHIIGHFCKCASVCQLANFQPHSWWDVLSPNKSWNLKNKASRMLRKQHCDKTETLWDTCREKHSSKQNISTKLKQHKHMDMLTTGSILWSMQTCRAAVSSGHYIDIVQMLKIAVAG